MVSEQTRIAIRFGLRRGLVSAGLTVVILIAFLVWRLPRLSATRPSTIVGTPRPPDWGGKLHSPPVADSLERSAWALVWDGLAPSIAVVLPAIVVTGILVGGMVYATVRFERHSKKLTFFVGHVAGTLSIAGLVYILTPVVFWFEVEILWISTGAHNYLVLSALFALVLSGFAARALLRYPDLQTLVDDPQPAIVDGWLATTWIAGGLVFVESQEVLREHLGVGYYWYEGVDHLDDQVIFATTIVLTLPVIAMGVIRETLLEVADSREIADGVSDGSLGDSEPAGVAKGDGGGDTHAAGTVERRNSTRELVSAIGASPRAAIGLGLFAVVAVVGVVVAVHFWNADRVLPQTRSELHWLVLSGLPGMLFGCVLTMTVSTVSGLAVTMLLEQLADRTAFGRVALSIGRYGGSILLNVPLAVAIYLLYLPHSSPVFRIAAEVFPSWLWAYEPFQTVLPFWFLGAILGGVFLAPLVASAIRRSRDRGYRRTRVVLSAVGVAATCAAVTTFVLGEILLLYDRSSLTTIYGYIWPEHLYLWPVPAVVGIGLPAFVFFLLGEGLRDVADDDDHWIEQPR